MQTYRRHDFSPQLPLVDVAHPGDAYPVTWQPIAVDADPITGHTPVACLLTFYGPYATGAEASQVAQNSWPAPGTVGITPAFAAPPAFVAPPLWLDALSGTPQQQAFTLPGDLAGGYYVVVAHSGAGLHLAVGMTDVRIVPRGA